MKIQEISLHNVGNLTNQEALMLSTEPLVLTDELQELLTAYFTVPFLAPTTDREYYRLSHPTDLALSEVNAYVSKIFADPQSLHEQSRNLAQYLYNTATHSKIKGGEFYVVYFEDAVVCGEVASAVGLFKSENKDTFLQVNPSGDNFSLRSEVGTNLKKLDKGCLIYNTEQSDGYVVEVVDNTNKNNEARYWIDDFLGLAQRQDEYYSTNQVLDLTKEFVTKQLPESFEVTRAQQADMLNRSVSFFKQHESFEMEDFLHTVIDQPEVIESFNSYRETYQQLRDVEIEDSFQISASALKKQARAFKSVIKLDKNFHIYIHGDTSRIENGEDHGGKYYKVYYDHEL